MGRFFLKSLPLKKPTQMIFYSYKRCRLAFFFNLKIGNQNPSVEKLSNELPFPHTFRIEVSSFSSELQTQNCTHQY